MIVEEQPAPLASPFDVALHEFHPAVPGLGLELSGEVRELEPAYSDAASDGWHILQLPLSIPTTSSTWGSAGRTAVQARAGRGRNTNIATGGLFNGWIISAAVTKQTGRAVGVPDVIGVAGYKAKFQCPQSADR